MENDLPKYRWVIVAMTSLTNLLGISLIGTGVTAVLLYTIKDSLSLTGVQVGLLSGAQSLVMWSAVFMGILADKYGVRKVCGIGLIITSFSALLRGFTLDFWTFFLASMLCGIGTIIFIPNPPKLLRAWFTSKELGLANGINMAGVGAGSAIAATITALYVLPAVGSWNMVYVVYSIPSFIGVILWWLLVRDNPPGKISKKTSSPFLSGFSHVAKLRSVQILAIERVFAGLSMVAFASFLPFLLQMHGFSMQEAGLMTSTRMWLNTIGAFTIPVLSDRIKKRKPLFMLCTFFEFFSCLLMIVNVPIVLWIAPMLYGFFGGGRGSLSLTITTEDVGPALGGTALGFLMTLGNIVGFAGSMIVGYLIDLYGSFSAPFLFSAITAGIMMVVSVAIKETYVQKK